MHDVVKIIGQDFIILSLLGLVGIWFGLHGPNKKRLAIELLLAGVIAYCLAKLGAVLYNDPRPFMVSHVAPYFTSSTDNGFPSDHTLLASLIGFLTIRYDRKAGIALLVLAVLIAVARVVAGVHHVADVIGAFVFSGAGVLIAREVLKRWDANPQKEVSEKQG